METKTTKDTFLNREVIRQQELVRLFWVLREENDHLVEWNTELICFEWVGDGIGRATEGWDDPRSNAFFWVGPFATKDGDQVCGAFSFDGEELPLMIPAQAVKDNFLNLEVV